jgi:hypothetical protein
VPLLSREEYVEQAHFFQSLVARTAGHAPIQELLVALREEALATTKLPMAIDFMLAELRHAGLMSTAMKRLGHYFSTFQTYVMEEAEDDRSRFDMLTGLEVLRFEAEYRAGEPTLAGTFMYQFETLCRNRLRYDKGLTAMAGDPIYDQTWREWIYTVRRQVGIIDLADLIYVRSEHYQKQHPESDEFFLFGEKEGKIALANRQKDPLFLFSALQRHLNYPTVPRPPVPDTSVELLPQVLRRLERLEIRLKLLEEEHKGGIDLTQFYSRESEGRTDH